MTDYKNIVHHDSNGKRIFYKDPPLFSKVWDWFWCGALLALIYLLLVYLGG